MRPPVTTGTPEKSVCEPNRILEHFGAARWKILCDLDRTRRVGLTTKSLETVCTGFMKRPGLSVPRRAVMGAAGNGPDGARLRALIVILCRAGLRIGEALDLAETDLEAARGAVLVRKGKGGRRREVGMDTWACQQLQSWLETRGQLPVGAWRCVIHGATAGRHWEQSAARKQPRRTAGVAGVHRRFAPRGVEQGASHEIRTPGRRPTDSVHAATTLRCRSQD